MVAKLNSVLSMLIESKSFSTDNAYKSHHHSKKHREKEVAHAQASHPTENPGLSKVASSIVDPVHYSASDEDAEEGTSDESEAEIDERLASARRRIQPSDCLFCPTNSKTISDNLDHMKSKHSFYIPDRDLLLDLPGLLSYLGEKVVLANLCLFCPNGGREFGDLFAVRKHMADKSHCKLAYETDADRAELADFYDFRGDSDDGSDWEEVNDEASERSEGIPEVRLHLRFHAIQKAKARTLALHSPRMASRWSSHLVVLLATAHSEHITLSAFVQAC